MSEHVKHIASIFLPDSAVTDNEDEEGQLLDCCWTTTYRMHFKSVIFVFQCWVDKLCDLNNKL